MKVDMFVKQSIDSLVEFEKYWEKAVETHPKLYPTEMSAGDWDEQFTAWLESGD